MDFRFCYYGLFCLLLQTEVYSVAHGDAKSCRQCKPGYHVSIRCKATHDTVCKPCSKGFFTHSYNVFDKCLRCSKCTAGEFVLRECTKHSDTICVPCSEASDVMHDAKYARECWDDNQKDQPLEESEHGIQLTDGDNDHNGIYESSGEHTLVEDVHAWLKSEKLEGSGETPDHDEVDNATYAVIRGDGHEVSMTTESTPIEEIIIPEGGTVLESDSGKREPESVISSRVPSSTNTTSPAIILEDESGTKLDDTGNLPEREVYVTRNGDQPHTGASKRNNNESISGASTGVVVTVGLVAALVFFALGFLASRYWSRRRERTFNVLEAERRNGAPVECIEFKDETTFSRKNHYDDINGQTAAKSPPNPTNGTPLVRESVQPTHAQPPPTIEPQEQETATSKSPVRPQSEIRYIDDEEVVETDRLLPPQASIESDHSVQRLSDEKDRMLLSDGTPNNGVGKAS
ncbi:uncharacterized protein LOC127833965 [Dreissena polymorpha]|uniref:uncharacterized protein LOC127833965 n=1 Tax=Dreissena polymorpha TaxID=45954 RepID=UPI0022649146|nr:uncharacterized protein LOC127833965 [Dreissena polymorpha]